METLRRSCFLDRFLKGLFVVTIGWAQAQSVPADVQITAPEGARSIRVRITDTGGREVFDSGAIPGSLLQWNRHDRHGRPVADGLYLAEIEMTDAAGVVSHSADTLVLQSRAPVDGTGTINFIPKFIKADSLGNSLIKEGDAGIGINLGSSMDPTAVLDIGRSAPPPANTRGDGKRATDALTVIGNNGGATGSPLFRGGDGANILLLAGSGGGSTVPGGTNGSGGLIDIEPGHKGVGGSGGSDGVVLIARSAIGRVGIGTIGPGAKVGIVAPDGDSALHVGAATTGSAMKVENSSSDFGALTIEARGVYGTAIYGSALNGVVGHNPLSGGIGVRGVSPQGTGVRGETATGYAGYFQGKVHINGTLTKAGGSFKIDHPLDPENRYLSHSFVESPDMMNIYNGNITTDDTGFAVVLLPPYFQALNRDFRYQLTVIGQFAQAIVGQEIHGNRFTIQTDKPFVKVSWQVTGIRQDTWANVHRIQVEEEKPANERGHALDSVTLRQPEVDRFVKEEK